MATIEFMKTKGTRREVAAGKTMLEQCREVGCEPLIALRLAGK